MSSAPASRYDDEIVISWAELHRQLSVGATLLHEASYVIVRELPAADWGYGGHTQAHRQAQRALSQAAPLPEESTPAIAADAQACAHLKPS